MHHREDDRSRCAGRSSAASISLFPLLGTSFIPELKEGTISPNMDRVPNISLDESIGNGDGSNPPVERSARA